MGFRFLSSTQHSGFVRSVIIAVGLLLVTGLWDQVSTSDALSNEKFIRVQSF